MRINNVPEMEDLPPPPYTPHDPASPGDASPNVADQDIRTSLRGGYIRPSLPSEMPSEGSNLLSAADYLEDRHPSIPNGGLHLSLVEHNITFAPQTTRNDILFPLPIETYIARDVTSLDWSTFVNYLFPMPDLTANEKRNNEKNNKPRTFLEEDTPERRQRIKYVIAEWNERFFSSRLIHVNAKFTSISSRAIPTNGASNTNRPVPVYQDGYAPLHRPHSLSSISSSSSSSSDTSVDSIKSRDLEGADIDTLRSALVAFRLDPSKQNHLRLSVRQLRDEFRSQRRDLPHSERKELKKEYKEQRKEIKREVKTMVKEIKATHKADRRFRKAEKKSRREGKRAETRGMDRVSCAQKKVQRQQERVAEKALRAQERGIEVQERAAEKATRARERAAESSLRAREAQAGGAAAATNAQEQATDAQARAWDSEAAARERAREIEERAQATTRNAQDRGWGAAGREKARLAELRAQEAINGIQGRNYGGAAVERAQETARSYQNRNYGSAAVERAQETARSYQGRSWGSDAATDAQETARNASMRAQHVAENAGAGDWGNYGREQARLSGLAGQNARQTASEATRGL